MQHELNIPRVTIINDFVAVGYAITELPPSAIEVLQECKPIATAPIGVIGAGTGLGVGFLTHNGSDYVAWPTEGGHASFAPNTELEWQLAQYNKTKLKLEQVSIERVVSGTGIPFIYEFLCERHPNLENKKVTSAIFAKDKGDRAIEIGKFAKEKEQLCNRALEIFVDCYGSEAGNLIVKTLCYGGLYIAGGIAPDILWILKDNNRFLKAMSNKGRMSDVCKRTPVYLIKNTLAGLEGSKVLARRLIHQGNIPGGVPAKLVARL